MLVKMNTLIVCMVMLHLLVVFTQTGGKFN